MPHRLRSGERYTGQMALIDRLGLRWPEPFVVSIVGAGSRQSVLEKGRAVERYTARYDYGNTAVGDLKFALRNEPLDLGLLRQALLQITPSDLERWIAAEPTGSFSRRAWFLYERLTRRRLSLEDVRRGQYVSALDPDRHIVCTPPRSSWSLWKRWRVIDNLLGTFDLCPTVRRTPRLAALLAIPIDAEIRRLIDGCDPGILRRAVQYLYTKETRSSFEIEGESVDEKRAGRFVHALRSVEEFRPSMTGDYVALQHLIIRDPRFRAQGWRREQIFVGETGPGYRHKIHYICPRARDVPLLMEGQEMLPSWLLEAGVHPIVAAAIVSFAFVFIHPFSDGNGRVHRYLIHWMLSTGGVTPPGMLFPISATILRDRAAYDAALESVSARVMPFIEWRWVGGEGGGTEVLNDTRDLYRFFDATAVVEYLYERVIETVRKDLPEELDYVQVYDRAYNELTERFDGLPAGKVSLLAALCLQNGGRLARGKRRLFPMLTDAEIIDAEEIIRQALAVPEAHDQAAS